MSQVKRDIEEEHEELLMAIEALGIEEKALVLLSQKAAVSGI